MQSRYRRKAARSTVWHPAPGLQSLHIGAVRHDGAAVGKAKHSEPSGREDERKMNDFGIAPTPCLATTRIHSRRGQQQSRGNLPNAT